MQNTITLAGKEYTIAALTLGQIEDLRVAVVAPSTGDPQKDVRIDMQRGREVIATALADQNVTADGLKNMNITLTEFNQAVAAVLELSGLIRRKSDAPAGEVAAEA